jgi:PKD repeat protein
MKRTFCTIILVLLFFTTWSQGWRNHEMEVRVFLDKARDPAILKNLGLEYEPASTDRTILRLYLVPGELERLKSSGLRYQVTIPDMNKHYEHFWDNPMVPSGYYSYTQIIAIADSLAASFPAICKKVIWGTSLGGRQLAALKISDNVNADETEAEIMFDGGIHGDEVGGSQNIIMFARHLCLGYNSDPTITNLVNSREIWLYLMVNPDGRAAMSRYNNNGVDINRDNGYMWNAEGNSTGAFSQIETKTLRNGILENQFVIYTNYHSGTEIVSYPWSYRSAPARDYDHLNALAAAYSSFSGYTSLEYGQGYNVMYPINGSTKDFQYGSLGNAGWSIEISLDKQPPASQINSYYLKNKPAMLEMINRCGWGATGMVTDSLTGEPVAASVWVNNLFPVYTDPAVGDYHKFLNPGTYTIRVMANGYRTKTISGLNVPSQGTLVKNFQLAPDSMYCAHKVMSCQIPGNNFDDEGYTPGAIGKADGVPYALGKNGWIVLDMKDSIFNGPGADFRVVQSGATQKAFTVKGGNNLDGPFTTIGIGTGTAGFDIGTVQLSKIRYLYIKDNGAGSATGQGAGYNLDAVEMITRPLIVKISAGARTFCAGTDVSFTDQSAGNPTGWNWSFPGGTPSSSQLQNPGNIHYNTPGTFDVTLTITNGVTSSTKTFTGFITVLTPPQVSLGNDTSICAWNSILLDAGIPDAVYLWSTGATTQTIMADSTGTGYGEKEFSVIVTEGATCVGYDTIHIAFETCTGIPDPEQSPAVSVYPNPAGDRFMLDVKGFDGGRWSLCSIRGVEIDHAEIAPAVYFKIFDLTSLAKGIYFIKVQKGDLSITRKVVVLGLYE